MIDLKNLTFGAEYEFGDIDRTGKLPNGLSWNSKDYSIVSSTGIANDPKGLLYTKGAEINSAPTETVAEQIDFFDALMAANLGPQLNHRTNLHLHVRVPGLSEDLVSLKRLLAYIHKNQAEIYRAIEPVPKPHLSDYNSYEEYKGALKRYKRRLVSHQYAVPEARVRKALASDSVSEFFAAHAPCGKDNKPAWGLTTRAGVNLLQLKETDTVEFRHFTNTLDFHELTSCFVWVAAFIEGAFDNAPVEQLLSAYSYKFPPFQLYNHDMEVGYQYTNFDKHSRKIVSERLNLLSKDLDLDRCTAKEVATWVSRNG